MVIIFIMSFLFKIINFCFTFASMLRWYCKTRINYILNFFLIRSTFFSSF